MQVALKGHDMHVLHPLCVLADGNGEFAWPVMITKVLKSGVHVIQILREDAFGVPMDFMADGADRS